MIDLPTPLNTMETYLYAINQKLNIVIEQNNAMADFIAKQFNTGVETTTEEIPTKVEKKPTTRKKTVKEGE